MALFTQAEEVYGDKQMILPGYKPKEKNLFQKAALAAVGLDENMKTNWWGKINPFLGPSQTIAGELIDKELNPAKQRMASSLLAGKLALNLVPGGALAKIGAGMAIDQAASSLSDGKSGSSGGIDPATGAILAGAALQSGANKNINAIGPSTPRMDQIDPTTGEAWKGSQGSYKEHLKVLKKNPELLKTDEQRQALKDALKGKTVKDSVSDVMASADEVDTDAIINGAGATDAAGAAQKGIKGAKFNAAMGKVGNVVGKVGLAAGIVSDAYAWHKSRQAADQAVDDKIMELREAKRADFDQFSYT